MEYCRALYEASEAAICLMEYSYGTVLYREYLLNCPEIPGAWHGLAICLEAIGNKEGSLNAYERALQLYLEHDDPQNLLWGGWCAFKLGKYELAYELFMKSLDKDPNYAYTWLSLGIAAFKIGKRSEGERAIGRYRVLIRERPYEKRECEGIRMLINAHNSLRRLISEDSSIIKLINELMTKSIMKYGELCK
ncbi:MAG: tetratricopeptide repeat protein [Vulcanisaeta sp.]|jgi:tetratricopeptide (TPR) repeat protein|uniref:Tetratricopeptide TPR_2 repeat protein n=1 Tax=Vulcanisaeta moutnovskia (strain 768-28) TaxID=985053 RepID=F0QWT8_VULM7|nr:CDC27 family protein [Vulcanisaeta moutnovskia]ADY01056.1 Tetratricopeptide TPR_2 repeat protein [Vulcanisaeta moutnovskia 768-28]